MSLPEPPDPRSGGRSGNGRSAPSPDAGPPTEGAPGTTLEASPPGGPPGGRIFTLEGRSAPGLYLVAWVLAVGGVVLALLIGPLASNDVARFVLVSLGAVLATLGFATACGYQVLERRSRSAERYRGPSPLLVFGTYFFLMAVIGIILLLVGGADPSDPVGFLVIGTIQAIGYVLVVWLVVVRTGALSWAAMGWPTWPGSGPVLASVITAAVIMLPATMGVLLLGGLIGLLLGVEAPSVLPATDDTTGRIAVVAAAAFVVPIGEELFFRGFALTAWLRDLGPRSALIGSSVFFALVHIANIREGFWTGLGQAALTIAVILPVGFLLGWLFLRRGLVAAIAGHIAYNGLLLALALAAGALPKSSG